MVSIVRAVAGIAGIPAGFPILLDAQMSIVEPAFSYLLELSIIPGRSHSTETLRTYSEHLHDWFDSLEQSGLDWRIADEGTIAAYRNRMLSDPSPHTGRPYARSTVNDRVRTVCRFYEWARRRGLIESLPFDYVDVSLRSARRQGMLAHLDWRAPVVMANILTVSEAERLPRPLRVDQLQCLFQHLDPPYDLIAEWALATGMRRKELCGLQLHQVPEVAHLSIEQDPLVGVPLTITKGDRPRSVYPPLRLIDRTHWYVGEDRVALIKRLRKVRPNYHAPKALCGVRICAGSHPVPASNCSAASAIACFFMSAIRSAASPLTASRTAARMCVLVTRPR
jgi:site-specific recombinase XerD